MSISIKHWVLSPHAVQRMEERKISLLEVRSIVEDPDSIIQQGPKLIFAKNISNRIDNSIAAVLLERKERHLWVVVTLMIQFEKKK